ncbi:MAG: tetratricopeptide repeat protein [Ktedonobacteraceae bacterium]
MSDKKKQQAANSQVDERRVQEILGHYHQIAGTLHESQDQQQAEAALTTINALTEPEQLALLKALSKEHDTDAADVATALNEFSPVKSVRKEARRALIRLQELRIYPKWSAPVPNVSALDQFLETDIDIANTPMRFWKGYVTDSRDVGEAQLLLLWEQGAGYKDVRILGFLLEFWHDGIKDFFTSVDSKRNIEKLIATTQARVELLDCSLAKGRSLIEEALAINKKYGTKPHRDFVRHRALVDSMVLQNPAIPELAEDDEDEDIGIDIDPDLEPYEVVTDFIDSWADQDFELAYNYLAEDSELREGLSEDEWIKRREEWAEAADPKRLLPNFVHEREAQKSGLWIPSPFKQGNSNASTSKQVDAGWSLELAEHTQSMSLPELPQATAVYQETGRHWFWTSYALVHEENGWRIQSMTDEGLNNQQLSVAELQKRIEDHNKRLEEITQQHQPTDPDAEQYLEEIVWRSMQAIYYDDALLKQVPLDQSIYMDAAGRAIILGEKERGLIYLEQAAEKFPEQRGVNLRQVAALQMQLSDDFYIEDAEDEDEEETDRSEHFADLAEATLRRSLQLEKNVLSYLMLAQVIIDSGDEDKLDEAEDLLHQAQTLPLTPAEEASVESTLGTVYMERAEYDQALTHYQRTLDLSPDFPGGWFSVGHAHRLLEQDEEAITAFKHALEQRPDDIEAYAEIADIYVQNDQVNQARSLLKEGLEANPESAHLLVLLSSTYMDSDLQHAEELLNEAESIDPDMDIVVLYRQVLEMRKQEQLSRKKAPPQRSYKKSRKKK